MKVLWLCNLILPEIAEKLGLKTIPKEGWVKSLYDAVQNQKDKIGVSLEIVLAFPVKKAVLQGNDRKRGFAQGENYFAFCEDVSNEHIYDERLESRMRCILDICEPDVVHCFGTEFTHALAMARALNTPEKLLIGMQGVCSEIAKTYLSHLPDNVVNRQTFRDKLKKDSISIQQQKYAMRGENEIAAIKLAGHVAGRTEFDRDFVRKNNPSAVYHIAGENLRKEFYSGAWMEQNSEKYRLFVSQADYPLKGFHYLLIAVGELLKDYEKQVLGSKDSDKSAKDFDVQIYVAGQSLVNYDTLSQKIKISSYGKYLRELIMEYKLEDRVHILGRLSAQEMKEQYLKCDTYVCCSSCENSPNSLGEAMMLQVPIVTANVGGISSVFDIVKDGYSYECDVNDSLDAVTNNLKRALLDRWNGACGDAYTNEVDKRRHNAGFHARTNHDTDNNALEMIKIYRDIAR